MERESLKPLVIAQLGESHLTVLSEETINAELDDALEGITDDAQVDDNFTKRIASRLLRMNGNVAKDAGSQINDWKKKHPVQQKKDGVDDDKKDDKDKNPEYESLMNEINTLKASLKEKADKEANDAVVAKVRAKFYEKYRELGITPKEYFVNQVFNKFTLPKLEDGENYDIEELQKKADESYTKELKDAGIQFEKPRKGGNGNSDKPSAEALRKREAFKKRMQSKGKLPKEESAG